MGISRITKVILKRWKKGKMTHLTDFIFSNSKVFNSVFNSMLQGSLNLNITFLGEKLWPVAWNKKLTSITYGKQSKNAYKRRKNENLEKQKDAGFFSHPFNVLGFFSFILWSRIGPIFAWWDSNPHHKVWETMGNRRLKPLGHNIQPLEAQHFESNSAKLRDVSLHIQYQ